MRLFAFVLLALLSANINAANRYVREGATGSGTGADWTNAFPTMPASLTRGDVYYVADGNYGSYTFDDGGTTLTTVRKATTTDHGTETGWLSTYGDGQAVFGNSISFLTSGWVFDGVSGSDYQPGHGFKLDNTAGTNTSNIVVFGNTGAAGVSNITVSHVDVIGPGYDQVDVNDRAFYSNSTGSTTSNLTISHNWVKGVGVPILMRQVDTILVEYNQIDDNHSQAASHAETWSDTGTDNVIFRYNKIRNPEGTAVFFIGNGNAGGTPIDINTSSNWDVYGNVFFYRDYVPGVDHNVGVGAVLWCPPFPVFGGDTFCDNWKIYNNTFHNFESASWIANRILGSAGAGITIPVVSNNIFNNGGTNATHVDITASHNYYRNTTHTSEANEQIGTTDPFVNAGADDFHLIAATTAGQTLSSPYNVDLDGVIRGGDGVFDRGAFEFGASSAPVVSALTCNQTTVQSPMGATICTATASNTPTSYTWSVQNCTTANCKQTGTANPSTFTCSCGGNCTICVTATNASGSSAQFCTAAGYLKSRYRTGSGLKAR